MNGLRKAMAQGMSSSPYQLNVVDWNQSLFWALLGVVSVGACISSTNQRNNAEYRRLELQQQKNELLAEVLRVQQQAAAQQQRLELFGAVLKPRDSSSSKQQQRWGPLKGQLLSALAG